jgi:hypothetical protein
MRQVKILNQFRGAQAESTSLAQKTCSEAKGKILTTSKWFSLVRSPILRGLIMTSPELLATSRPKETKK